MRNFYNLLGNTLVTTITNMTVWFALTYYIYLQTQSVLATGILSGIFTVSVAGSGFWLGGFVDNYDKKKLLFATGILTLLIYALGLIVYIFTDPKYFTYVSSPVLWIMVVLLMTGVLLGNIRGIALPALITVMVDADKRDKANGLAGTVTGIAFLVVSGISGFLVAWGGMLYALIMAVVLTLVTLVHLFFINIPSTKPDVDPESGESNKAKLDIGGTVKVIRAVPGLLPLIFFTMFNNFLGGVFMALMDAYGLSLVSVEIWGLIWAVLSLGFIVGGGIIAKFGLGKNPVKTMFLTNIVIWSISSVFTLQPSIYLLSFGMFIYLCVMPFIEASEHTIIQKVVPAERQGRVFGFAQSVEQAASPITAFLIGPLTELVFIPFMTTGQGVDLIGWWFGVGASRGMALVFTLAGLAGLFVTILFMNSKFYKNLSNSYLAG